MINHFLASNNLDITSAAYVAMISMTMNAFSFYTFAPSDAHPEFKIWQNTFTSTRWLWFVREICDLIVKLVLKDKSEYDMPYLNAQASFQNLHQPERRMGRKTILVTSSGKYTMKKLFIKSGKKEASTLST